MPRFTRPILTLVALFLAIYGPPIYHRLRVLGVIPTTFPAHAASSSIRTIRGTRQCEDLHHHAESGLLFTACEGQGSVRVDWFPPLAHFDRPEDVPTTDEGRGGLVVVDPKSFTSTRLTLEGFTGAFVTHGIDIIDDPSNPSAIYIYAVNHAPASPLPSSRAPEDIVASRIEVFHHTLGTTKATHLRTVRHPLIRTPNDIYALSPTELLVTNDHAHRAGLLRTVEDIVTHPLSPKTSLVHVSFSLDSPRVDARVALDGLHNCNGLGHGPSGQLLLVDAAGGILHLGTPNPPSLHTSIPHATTLDNPSFYASTLDASQGYLNAGLTAAHTLATSARNATALDPSIVWYLAFNSTTPKVLFHDDGARLRTASAAVIVDDEATRERWLFATGFLSEAMVAMPVEV